MADVLCGKIPGVHDAEVQIERPDGSRIIVIVNIGPLKGRTRRNHGSDQLLLRHYRRKQAEEVGQHLVSIVEASDDAIISKDLDGIVKSWNQGARAPIQAIGPRK